MDTDEDTYVAENFPEEVESYRKYINQLPNKKMALQPTYEASSSAAIITDIDSPNVQQPFPYNNDNDFFTSLSPMPVSTYFRRSPNRNAFSFVTPLVQQSLDTPTSISLIDETQVAAPSPQDHDYHTPRSSRSPINDNQTTPQSRTATPLNNSDQNMMHTETTPIVKTKISQPHTSTRKKRGSSKLEDDFLIASMEASRAIADAVKENSNIDKSIINNTEQRKLKYYNFWVSIAESLESLELDLAEDAKFEIYNIIYQFEKKQRARQNSSN